ncbi:hypothetical protein HYALB_00006425 [Hymenoscyphus albidus]|uniref:Epoxide hydrolase N-terminal domain-containing protein n=1 Tax=Hymenoscyphus albidus TaxID=595503 RepID=A0A9N9LFY8_9HELO|nr:hypothetical protein HYALB_00006425 [Hymenoscyphus albidus]
MATPKPFQIAVPQEKIDKFKLKLSLAELPDELEGAGWDYGVPLAEMKRLTKAYEKWDWRQAEARLNKLPQYTTTIKVDGYDELDIHFLWQKSKVKNAIPLLMVHGVCHFLVSCYIWSTPNLIVYFANTKLCLFSVSFEFHPSLSTHSSYIGPASFIEFQHILPLLADNPDGPAFHIVAPSLPNFGFSSGVKTRGFAPPKYSETLHKLMLSLGYTEYATQGGDWGYFITRIMGRTYPESVKASHINTMACNPPENFDYSTLTEREKAGLDRSAWFVKEGQGYYHQQTTQPQTLAYALNDSPVALLAWIYDKLHFWTDSYPWTDDEIFTWISVYAYSRAGPGASLRIYYEHVHGEGDNDLLGAATYVPHVKLGLAHNPKEMSAQPISWSRQMGPIVYDSVHDSGGHFMASERPHYLAKDLKTMFGKEGGAFGAVPGKNGYDA